MFVPFTGSSFELATGMMDMQKVKPHQWLHKVPPFPSGKETHGQEDICYHVVTTWQGCLIMQRQLSFDYTLF